MFCFGRVEVLFLSHTANADKFDMQFNMNRAKYYFNFLNTLGIYIIILKNNGNLITTLINCVINQLLT